AEILGSASRARATRTFSRAAPRSIPHFQLSQCAHDCVEPSAQPSRRSNSAIRTSQRWLAAFRWPASSVICASSSAIGKGGGADGLAAWAVAAGSRSAGSRPAGSKSAMARLGHCFSIQYFSPGPTQAQCGSLKVGQVDLQDRRRIGPRGGEQGSYCANQLLSALLPAGQAVATNCGMKARNSDAKSEPLDLRELQLALV